MSQVANALGFRPKIHHIIILSSTPGALENQPPQLRIHRQPKPCARPWRPHFPSAPRLLPLGVPSYLPSWPDPMRSHEIWPPDDGSDVQPLGVDFLTFFSWYYTFFFGMRMHAFPPSFCTFVDLKFGNHFFSLWVDLLLFTSPLNHHLRVISTDRWFDFLGFA